MFGRVAAGLVHDLSHPFKNIQNNCRLMLKMHDDPEYRELFARTVDREFSTITPRLRGPAQPREADAARAVPARPEQAGRRGARACAPTPPTPAWSSTCVLHAGDLCVDGRHVRHRPRVPEPDHQRHRGHAAAGARRGVHGLVGPGGRGSSSTDTGCGIPPERLAHAVRGLRDDQAAGPGLGLAISKKIVEQLGGTIAVDERGRRGHDVHGSSSRWRTAAGEDEGRDPAAGV